MNQRTYPLFRTVALLVLAEPPAAATVPPPGAHAWDLTDFVGATVDASTWQALQAECVRRYGSTWTLYADQVDDGYHIARLAARLG